MSRSTSRESDTAPTYPADPDVETVRASGQPNDTARIDLLELAAEDNGPDSRARELDRCHPNPGRPSDPGACAGDLPGS